MDTFLTTLHILASVSLIIVVLLQRGRGSDMGAMLGGGGSQTVFGARGAGNFLTKLTAGCAVTFMVTSLSLAVIASRESKTQIFDGSAVEEPAPEGLEDVGDGTAAGSGLEEIEDAAAGGLEEISDSAPEAATAAPDAGEVPDASTDGAAQP